MRCATMHVFDACCQCLLSVHVVQARCQRALSTQLINSSTHQFISSSAQTQNSHSDCDLAVGFAELVLLLREQRTEQKLAQRSNVTRPRVATLAVALDLRACLVRLEVAAVRATEADLSVLRDLDALREAFVALVLRHGASVLKGR